MKSESIWTRLAFVTRLVVMGTAFGVIYQKLNIFELPRIFSDVSLLWFSVAVVLTLVKTFTAVGGVRLILRSVRVRIPYLDVLRYTAWSNFFSTIHVVVGGAMRFKYFAGSEKRRGEAIFAVLMERFQRLLIYLVVLVVLGTAGLGGGAFWRALGTGWIIPLVSLSLGAFMIGWLLWGAGALALMEKANQFALSHERLLFFNKRVADLIRVLRNHRSCGIKLLGSFVYLGLECFLSFLTCFALIKSLGWDVPYVAAAWVQT
ncbi:MAG: flippase-like domain-containing protein [Candidatus Omnitrophica bacterium]|nr:flippase-like domain-containing protein [Candidatus Omnitrophota bacterium]